MKTVSIYPSLLAIANAPEKWSSETAKLQPISSGIHYDIGDGDFVPSMMLPIEDIRFVGAENTLPRVQDIEPLQLPIDVHLMVQRPSEYFQKLFSFPLVQAVAFHVECQEDIHANIQALKNAGKKVGLAILNTTPADHLDPYILEIDYVLVMTVKGGYSGTPFIPEMLQKITDIRNKNPDIMIVVDGGIGEKTLPPCLEAGATGAVMSSALFGGKDISWVEEFVK